MAVEESDTAKHRLLFQTMPQGVVFQDAVGQITDANPAAERILGLSLDQMQDRTSRDPRWKAVREDGSDFPGDEHPAMVALQTGEPANGVMGVFNPDESDYRWISIDAVPLVPAGSDTPTGVATTFEDVTARKQAEGALRDLEWMLSPVADAEIIGSPAHEQPYGDLTALNTDMTILEAVGKENLGRIAADFLDLLGTSAAVYERNGDYAFGIFTSGWCRVLDAASRALCQTDDDAEALASGDWLCHESCWTDCSKKAIETGRPADIECSGGIHLYGVPIVADDAIVGAIDVGYGDPPGSDQALREVAERYGVSVAELRREADAYDSRPLFVVELAKRRVRAAARAIGQAVERSAAEQARVASEDRYRQLVKNTRNCVAVYEPTDDGRDFVIREFNAAAEATERVDRSRVLGRRVTEVFPGVEEFGLLDVFRRVFATGEPEQHPVSRYEDERLAGWRDNYVYRLPSGEIVAVYEDVTEQKQAELALRAGEERWRSYVENAPYGVFEADENGRYLLVNAEARRITGYDEEELLGMSIPDLIPADAREEALEHFSRLLEEGRSVGDVPFLTKAGERRRWSISAVNLGGGRLLGFTEDVTERQAAEEALRASEERFSSLFETVTEGVALHDVVYDDGEAVDYRIVAVNPAFERHTGLSREKVVGKLAGEAYGVADQPYLREYAEVAAGGGSHVFETHFGPLDRMFQISVVSPRPGSFATVFEDISERKDAEDALRASEAFLSTVMQRSPFAMWVAGPDGVVVRTNDSLRRTLRVTDEQVVGRYNVLEDENLVQEGVMPQVRAVFDEQTPARFSIPWAPEQAGDVDFSGGRPLEIDVSMFPITGTDGSLQHVVCQWVDITDRVRSEEALRESRERLRLAMEAAGEGTWEWDFANGMVTFDEIGYEMLGYRPDEIEAIGEWWISQIHPDDRPRVERAFSDYIEGRAEEYGVVFRIRHKDESYIWVTSDARIVRRDENGEPLLCVGIHRDITEEKQAEEERLSILRERADLLRSMTNAFVIFESVFDEDGTFVSYRFEYINDAYERITGVTLDEVRGKTVHEVWPGTEPSWIENYGAVAVSGETRRFEMFHKPTDKMYDCTVYRPWDTTDRFCVVFEDITERKQREEALRESEDKFRYVFDRSVTGKSLTSPDGGMRVNEAFCAMLGYSADELQELRWQEITYPDDVGANEAAIAPLLAGEKDWVRFTKRYLHKDGSIVWADVSTSVRRDESGEVLYFMTAIQDITEQKAAEDALRESERRLRQAQHIARMGDVTWNVETGAVWWSDGMHELAGYERTETFDYGRVNRELHHPDDLERVTKWLGECVASGERPITPNEYRIVRKDGEVVWVHVEGVVERDEAGAPTVFATVQDITELKEAQQAIAELNAELEQRVIDRTAALEAVNAELESMTYSVSHDLRAPVRHIAGFSDLLQENIGTDLDERQRHYLERISASVGQMGDLIDDLLEFSRTGRVELEIEDVDMGAAVEAARETVRPQAGDREIEWIVGELPPVRGDERLLRLAWTNLLDNAVKFTRPRERACIEVAASRSDGEIVYFVRDNGVGFDPRYAGKMFGVFQRMHPADEFEGTGVGLANVRRAIARLGGRTWAEGAVDDGATFYFSIPTRREV